LTSEKYLWQKTAADVLNQFDAVPQGLSSVQAEQRLARYGPNQLISQAQKTAWQIFLEQFTDFLVLILLAAVAISAFLGDWESVIVILAVIILNALLGTFQTLKAASSLEGLKQLSAPTAKVLRDDKLLQIPSHDVTLGDIVLLEAGDAVCADGRLLECASLKCAESALTGESLPVEKSIGEINDDVPLGDRNNLVFSGSFVTYGRGKFVVTAIGMATEIGKIAALLNETAAKKTPLQISLDKFSKTLTLIILSLCSLIFAVNVFIQQENILNAFLFAVALAVAAIPEALSSIVTIVLSFGTQKMAQENAIIRKLQAVEGLGSISIICSDKTGTLTQNKMTVQDFYPQNNEEFLLRSALLCNDATISAAEKIGDPTEIALVAWGQEKQLDADDIRARYPRLAELPFDSERKLMSTVHQFPEGLVLITKGAVDVLLQRTQLSPAEKENIFKINQQFSERGLRVLAFGWRQLKSPALTLNEEQDLTFLGLVAMMDPPRPESAAAVADCKAAGIRPIMITGDHKVTAAAIAKEIGILTPETKAVEGSELEHLDDKALQQLVPAVSVYARVSPEHKIRIVRAWQNLGNSVAMTGDGVNDAPALKQADIGIAMGITGTEVAKDAADMVLTDDNFATIVHAVKNGRNVYANITKAIHFLLSGNTAGILTVLYASLRGLPVPFAAVHLLFINLLTDSLPAIALGLEPHNDQVMQEKPRSQQAAILNKNFLFNIVLEGSVIALATILAFHLGLNKGNAAIASTMAFATLCLSRLLHGFNCKAESPIIFTEQLWNNRVLFLAFFLGITLLTAVLFIPFVQPFFQIAVLTPPLLTSILLLALGTLIVIQILKWLKSLKK